MNRFFEAIGYLVSVLAAAFGIVCLLNKIVDRKIDEEIAEECECDGDCADECECTVGDAPVADTADAEA